MDAPQPTALAVERVGTRRYVGTSTRGARVEIGSADTPDVFTPGELLKIALAACTAMASDHTVARRLGEDYHSVVRVSGDADRDEEVYPELHERYELDLSGLSAEEVERLEQVLRRSVDRSCTVGRTLARGTAVELDVVDLGTTPVADSGAGAGADGGGTADDR